jgi:hypothetical protein
LGEQDDVWRSVSTHARSAAQWVRLAPAAYHDGT